MRALIIRYIFLCKPSDYVIRSTRCRCTGPFIFHVLKIYLGRTLALEPRLLPFQPPSPHAYCCCPRNILAAAAQMTLHPVRVVAFASPITAAAVTRNGVLFYSLPPPSHQRLTRIYCYLLCSPPSRPPSSSTCHTHIHTHL